MDINSLGDEVKQSEGVWSTYEAPDGSTFDLCIAAANNRNFRDKQTKLLLSAQRSNKGKPISITQFPEVVLKASIGTVLTDWRGLTKGDAEYPFTEEAALDLLSRRTLEVEAIRRFIDERSVESENFQGESESAQKAEIKSGDPLVP